MKDFKEFERIVDTDAVVDELLKIPTDDIQSSGLTNEEASFLMSAAHRMALALLRQYHEWLSQ